MLLIEADLAACGSAIPVAVADEHSERADAETALAEATEAPTMAAEITEIEPPSVGDASADMTGSLPNLVSEGTAQLAREYETVVTIQSPYYP